MCSWDWIHDFLFVKPELYWLNYLPSLCLLKNNKKSHYLNQKCPPQTHVHEVPSFWYYSVRLRNFGRWEQVVGHSVYFFGGYTEPLDYVPFLPLLTSSITSPFLASSFWCIMKLTVLFCYIFLPQAVLFKCTVLRNVLSHKQNYPPSLKSFVQGMLLWQ